MAPSHSQTPRLTRRAVLGTMAGAVAAVAGLPLLLGEPPATSAAADVQLRAPEPNPKYGGVLRYGITSTPPHFDIHQSGTVNNMGTQGCMYDNLIRRNPLDSGQTIIPDLAHQLGDRAGWQNVYVLSAQGGHVPRWRGVHRRGRQGDLSPASSGRRRASVSPAHRCLRASARSRCVTPHTIEFTLHEPRPGQSSCWRRLRAAGTSSCASKRWKTIITICGGSSTSWHGAVPARQARP